MYIYFYIYYTEVNYWVNFVYVVFYYLNRKHCCMSIHACLYTCLCSMVITVLTSKRNSKYVYIIFIYISIFSKLQFITGYWVSRTIFVLVFYIHNIYQRYISIVIYICVCVRVCVYT